jgi:hypothetical protein
VSQTEDDLRAVAESLAVDADRLKSVEQAKATLPIDDAELAELTKESAQIIDEISTKGAHQEALVEESTSGS